MLDSRETPLFFIHAATNRIPEMGLQQSVHDPLLLCYFHYRHHVLPMGIDRQQNETNCTTHTHTRIGFVKTAMQAPRYGR